MQIDESSRLQSYLARLLIFHQKLLDDRSSTLFDLIICYKSIILKDSNQLGTQERARYKWNRERSEMITL
ncbi:unnamed protein product [Cuscuta campestris]|uniref:Uncharacterized protein n=1 Tax=Cuscuta campestris TaxID=132261 RepID=A0A484M619_9ASTE|nr:unnamed protein product [Cuscuta campestris]